MCGVFGAVLPGGEPTDAASIAALGLFALQHRGQESAGLAVSDGEQLMLYKDLGMISTVLDERRLPSLRGQLAIAHCRYSTTGSTIWENAQPTYRLGPRRALAIGHNGNLVNTRDLLDPARGRPDPPAGLDRHGAADGAARRRTGRGHGRGAAAGPAARPRRVQPGRPRRAPGHRRARPVRLPAARPRSPAAAPRRPAAGRRPVERRRRVGRLVPVVRDGRPRHRRRRVRPRRPARRDGHPGAGPGAALGPLRRGDAGAVRLRAHLLRPPGLVHGGSQPVRGPPPDGDAARASSIRSTPTWSCPCPTPARRPRPATPRRPACRTARGCTATAMPAGPSSSRRPGLRHRGVTIKLNPLREVVNGKRLIVVDDSIVRGTTTKRIVELLRKAGATEVHVRISAPPIYHPCFYGIDTSDRDRADRVHPHRARDPRVHRRRFARLPVDPRRPRRARAAVRAVLLRLLRRPLPGAGPVRRHEPQVHARRAGRGARRGAWPRAARPPIGRPAWTSRPASAPWT